MTLGLQNDFATQMTGFYVPWSGAVVPNPQVLRLNEPLAAALGLDPRTLHADILTGSTTPAGATPLAMAYAGHQFGGFSPQLGDGRALLMGEIIAPDGTRFDLHLKGSGRTPFARGGDGKAVLGPMLREYLIGEAMHAYGIPTTRALAVSTTGEVILRNGPEPGAVLARVAQSHLRVGTFQFFAARNEVGKLQQLTDYAIARHDPDLRGQPDRALRFLRRVAERQARLVAQWMGVGFVHGVMNTDNTTISGETIDYGPCAFIDAHDPGACFSSIDQHGRYAYGNQPAIIRWNLARLAEALLPVINPDDPAKAIPAASEVIADMASVYEQAVQAVFAAKLGLLQPDLGLIDRLLALMAAERPDHTAFFRALPTMGTEASPQLQAWLADWRGHLARQAEGMAAAVARMATVNPIYIPRNHCVNAALDAAWMQGDMAPFDRLLRLLRAPFSPAADGDDLAKPPPPHSAPCVTFCGT